jgi:hypothetical protein
MHPMDAFVPGPVYRFLADDHARLERLLEDASAHPGAIDAAAYADFRKGLLRHIGMEEKILLPAAQRARSGVPLPDAPQLRLEHGAIAALLVPPPTPTIVRALRAVLARHNAVEEGPEGVYATCERSVGDGARALLSEIQAAPEVPVAPHVEGPRVMGGGVQSAGASGPRSRGLRLAALLDPYARPEQRCLQTDVGIIRQLRRDLRESHGMRDRRIILGLTAGGEKDLTEGFQLRHLEFERRGEPAGRGRLAAKGFARREALLNLIERLLPTLQPGSPALRRFDLRAGPGDRVGMVFLLARERRPQRTERGLRAGGCRVGAVEGGRPLLQALAAGEELVELHRR